MDIFKSQTTKNYELLMGILVQTCEKKLNIIQNENWSLQGILSRDISSLLYFLVQLSYKIDCNFEIPSDVSIAVTCKTIQDGVTKNKTTVHRITDKIKRGSSNLLYKGRRSDIDTLDELMEDPDILAEINGLLLIFVNSSLSPLHIKLASLEQMSTDHIIMMMGLLGRFYVPASAWVINPKNGDDNLRNANVCYSLLQQDGIDTKRVSPEG